MGDLGEIDRRRQRRSPWPVQRSSCCSPGRRGSHGATRSSSRVGMALVLSSASDWRREATSSGDAIGQSRDPGRRSAAASRSAATTGGCGSATEMSRRASSAAAERRSLAQRSVAPAPARVRRRPSPTRRRRRGRSSSVGTTWSASPSSSDRIRHAAPTGSAHAERAVGDARRDRPLEQRLPRRGSADATWPGRRAGGLPRPRRRARAGTPSPCRPGCRSGRRPAAPRPATAPRPSRSRRQPEVLRGDPLERRRQHVVHRGEVVVDQPATTCPSRAATSRTVVDARPLTTRDVERRIDDRLASLAPGAPIRRHARRVGRILRTRPIARYRARIAARRTPPPARTRGPPRHDPDDPVPRAHRTRSTRPSSGATGPATWPRTATRCRTSSSTSRSATRPGSSTRARCTSTGSPARTRRASSPACSPATSARARPATRSTRAGSTTAASSSRTA